MSRLAYVSLFDRYTNRKLQTSSISATRAFFGAIRARVSEQLNDVIFEDIEDHENVGWSIVFSRTSMMEMQKYNSDEDRLN